MGLNHKQHNRKWFESEPIRIKELLHMGKGNGMMSVLATISAGAAVFSYYQNHKSKQKNSGNVIQSILTQQKQ